jgi:NADP-dependent 3-hydroxy acid dehydrogenase YdfG
VTAGSEPTPGSSRTQEAGGHEEASPAAPSLADALVVVTGAGGPAGQATVRRLVSAGARVVGADVHADRLAALSADLGTSADRFQPAMVDLLDESATRDWATALETEYGHIDGVLHLVGGWRGGRTFPDNTTADAELLHALLVRTLQHTTLAFHDALLRSGASGREARFAIVSAQAASKPTAGGAGYAAAKAAAEAWLLALADAFRKAESGRKTNPLPQHTAAVVLVIKAILTPQMRAEKPDAAFPGFTDVADLAGGLVGLWNRDAGELNGQRLPLGGLPLNG